ncbi:MAG: putative maltokinase [Rhodobacterales bacterium]|nr:putative maltokinase [Rhodobacterales bacterium]
MSRTRKALPPAHEGTQAALTGAWREPLERDLLPPFLAHQRWFGAKDQQIGSVTLTPLAELDAGCALCVVDLSLSDEDQRYFLPLAVQGWTSAGMVADVGADGALVDGANVPDVAQALLDGMRAGSVLPTGLGDMEFEGSDALRALETGVPRLLAVEQSNVALVFGQEVILKLYRRLRRGIQPEVEMARHLTGPDGFAQTPALLGSIALHEGDEITTLAAAFAFAPNQGDAWSHVTRLLAQQDVRDDTGIDLIRCLGKRTGDLHRALARASDDPDFAPQPISTSDLADWTGEALDDLDSALDTLGRATLDARAAPLAKRVLDAQSELRERISRAASLPPSGQCTRIHGDYHLGQVLVTGSDVAIIDFEGEPRRSLAARRAKTAQLRDVAGMIRSLDYAARSAERDGADSTQIGAWRKRAGQAYLSAYEAAMDGVAARPDPDLHRALLDLFLIQKAAYEIGYELANRPGWAHLPLAGLLALTKGGTDA